MVISNHQESNQKARFDMNKQNKENYNSMKMNTNQNLQKMAKEKPCAM